MARSAAALVACFALASVTCAEDRIAFFEARIRPVLIRHCYECHSVASTDLKGGLKLDSRDALRRGGESGPSLVPGQPDNSLLLAALRQDGLEMPPGRRLPDSVIADFEQWIRDGAADPRDAPPTPQAAADSLWEATYQDRLNWWSLQPLADVAVPQPERRDWSPQSIDQFILKRLEESGLQPAPRADRRTLLRRLSFALTGLPPRPADVAAFVPADSSESFSQLVDRLLDSPHFGEHWARHWMDVARYTDTYGYEWDIPAKGAWRYRDYLIRALNADVPFDQLVREQIAGDLLEAPRLNRELQINESLIGPMFFQMGEKRHGDSADFNGIHQEMLDNKIDAFSKAFQGITVSCARCHDHKLDPISQREYYALGGVLFSPRWVTNTLDLPERNAAVLGELRELKRAIRTKLAASWQAELGIPETASAVRIEDAGVVPEFFDGEPVSPLEQGIGIRPAARLPEAIAGSGSPGGAAAFRPGSIARSDVASGNLQRQRHADERRFADGLSVLNCARLWPTFSREFENSDRPLETGCRSAAPTAELLQPFAPDSGCGEQANRVLDSGVFASLVEADELVAANELIAADELVPANELIAADELVPAAQAAVDSRATSHWTRLLEAARQTPPPIESPLFPLFQLQNPDDAKHPVAERWQRLATRYADESRTRREKNAQGRTVLADFRDGVPPDWSADGVGTREMAQRGDFAVTTSGDVAIEPLQLGGLMTNRLSSRLNGALRSPLLGTIEQPLINVEVSGGEFATHRTVIDNAFLTERQGYLNAGRAVWQQFSTRPAGNAHAAYVEFATKTSNPNFPPRVGLGGACSEQQAADPRSWFCISRVVAQTSGGAPLDDLNRFASLFNGEPPTTDAAAAQRYSDWFRRAIENWSRDAATDDDVLLINWLLENGLLSNKADMPALNGLVARYRETEQRVEPPQTVNGMADLDAGTDYRLNHRGDYDELRDAIPRGYLRFVGDLCGAAVPDGRRSESGRRELAELVASPRNPLTARVYVNRVWHWLFGAGIVATPGNFGQLGERPSHPELLDWLANEFIADDWSTRRLIRRIVLSETWQQSGQASESGLTADPRNRLLHHFSLRRLTAEEIRDAILSVSGRLDDSLFGPPVDPFRTNEDAQKRLFAGPLDGNGRRSIYTKITIMEAPKFLDLFNQPKPKIPTSRRDVSSTPAQSLALLNDPFVKQQSEFCGARISKSRSESPSESRSELRPESFESRLDELFIAALSRPLSDVERARWNAAARAFQELEANGSEDDLRDDPTVWAALAHSVFNLKEFIYVR